MNKLLNSVFFKRIGFYVSLVSAVSMLVAVLNYTFGFTGVLAEYNSSNVMTMSLVGIAVFFVLLVFKPTSDYAPLVLWVSAFVSFLVYVSNIYMYFTGVFYNGVSAEAFKLIDPTVMTSTVLFVVSVIAGNIAMYMRHSKEKEE